jgi:hypothetical protein
MRIAALTFTLVVNCVCGCGKHPGDTSPELLSPAGALTKDTDELANDVRQNDWFEDVTEKSGINFQYRNGREGACHFILESLGGGVAMVDYDRDGDLDLFFTGGGVIGGSPPAVTGLPSGLFRNDGNLRFVDVSEEAGFQHAGDYSHGVSVVDFDQDGFPDLFVCCYGQSRLYRNTRDERFQDVTGQAGLSARGWNTAAAWGDIDADGWPDLYVARYLDWSPEKDRPCLKNGIRDLCGPRSYGGVIDCLYRNQGNGTFEDISQQAGLIPGNGLGVVAADLNNDGRIDFYTANDESNNHLYLGNPELPLTEAALISGVATNEYGMPDGSMGVDVGDVNGDGNPDLWTTNFEREDNGLYCSDGNGLFRSATLTSGLAGHSRLQVGFGTALADFDGDGWLDIFVTNGHVFYHGRESAYRQQAQLFRNDAGRFENVSAAGGTYFRSDHVGRGAAIGDLDNDGALDLVVVHQNESVSILRNRTPPKHFVRVRLQGTQSDRDAIGAVASIRSSGRTLMRWVRSGAGYFSHSDQRILFAVDDDAPVDVTVDWLGRGREVFGNLKVGETHELVEGRGKSE